MALETVLGGGAALRSATTLAAMPDVLAWGAGGEVLGRVHDIWRRWASEAMGLALAHLYGRDPDRAKALLEALRGLSDEAMERLLLAPEVTSRLRAADPASVEAMAEELAGWIAAEHARMGPIAPPGRTLWSARGDGHVDLGGIFRWGPRIAGWVPLDVQRPWSLELDPTGARARLPTACPPTGGAELDTLLASLARVRVGIDQASPLIGALITLFTKVLVLQRDEDADDGLDFTSGSSGRYLGRTVLANAHLASDAELAEALVREAIHALLSVQDEHDPWVLDEELARAVSCLASPWTGRPLPVRALLHDCFVEYGLVHFWRIARHRASFVEPRSTRMLHRALSGFSGAPLATALAPFRTRISPAVVRAVSELQERVARLAG